MTRRAALAVTVVMAVCCAHLSCDRTIVPDNAQVRGIEAEWTHNLDLLRRAPDTNGVDIAVQNYFCRLTGIYVDSDSYIDASAELADWFQQHSDRLQRVGDRTMLRECSTSYSPAEHWASQMRTLDQFVGLSPWSACVHSRIDGALNFVSRVTGRSVRFEISGVLGIYQPTPETREDVEWLRQWFARNGTLLRCQSESGMVIAGSRP